MKVEESSTASRAEADAVQRSSGIVVRATTIRLARRWSIASSLLNALPLVAAVTLAVVLVVRANLFFMHPRAALLFPPDEGYESALGWRLLSGKHLPYVDGVSHRGPVFYWSIALAEAVLGTGTWMPLRILSLGCMLLTVGLGVLAAVLAQRSLAGALFALALPAVWFGDLLVADGLGYNSEQLVNVFALAALVSICLAVRGGSERRSSALFALAGICTMLSALSKQVGIVIAVPFLAWIAAFSWREGAPSGSRTRPLVAFFLGLGAPLAAVLAWYALARELPAFFYYFFTYNVGVYAGALDADARHKAVLDELKSHYELLLIAAPVVGLGCSHLLLTGSGSVRARLGRYAASGFDGTVLVALVATLFAANASLRNFPHYYLQVLPWAALLGGLFVEGVLRQWAGYGGGVRAAGSVFVARTSVLLPLAVLTAFVTHDAFEGHAKDTDLMKQFETETWPICKYLHRHTSLHDSIFIWGFDPAAYTACNRRPASRYVFTTFVAGYVPWIDAPAAVEDARAAPHSRELLIRDLEREKPPVIFDAKDSMAGRSLFQIDVLRRYVKAYYCEAKVKGLPPTWVRKEDGRCPPMD